MLALKFALLLFLFAMNLVGPGLYFLRSLRWSPTEKFCASVALSQFIVFVLAFGLFCTEMANGWYWLITAAGAGTTFAVRRDLRMLWQHHGVKAQVRTYLILLPMGLCMMGLIRVYAGGVWAGDWLEHHQRVLFFLQHHSSDEIFIDLYKLPARPPMIHLIAASYMAQMGETSFAAFQLVFLLLNLLIVLPCVMLLPMLGARHRRFSLTALTFLLAASPMLFQNLSWTWPRLLTTFYVLLAMWFYLRGWWRNDPARMIASFVCLAIGALVHYSVGPYIVILLAHYGVIFFLPRVLKLLGKSPPEKTLPIRPWREPLLSGALSAAVLLVWFSWSVFTYGWKVTFESNTTVAGAAETTFAQNVLRFLYNLYYTIVPHTFSLPRGTFWGNFIQESPLGYLRDYMFTLYQQNVFFNLGSIGGLLVIYQLVRVLIVRKEVPIGRKIFWWYFIVASTLLGILVVGTLEVLGAAHSCLQPMMFLGMILLAATLRSFYKWVRVILVVACAIDFTLGIYLHATLEHRVFNYMPAISEGKHVVVIVGGGGLNERAPRAWNAKIVRKLHFIGDDLDRIAVVVQVLFIELFALSAYWMWYICIVERKRVATRQRRSLRDLLPRSPTADGYTG
jgi:hypothetical protein